MKDASHYWPPCVGLTWPFALRGHVRCAAWWCALLTSCEDSRVGTSPAYERRFCRLDETAREVSERQVLPGEGQRGKFEQKRPTTALRRPYSLFQCVTDQFGDRWPCRLGRTGLSSPEWQLVGTPGLSGDVDLGCNSWVITWVRLLRARLSLSSSRHPAPRERKGDIPHPRLGRAKRCRWR